MFQQYFKTIILYDHYHYHFYDRENKNKTKGRRKQEKKDNRKRVILILLYMIYSTFSFLLVSCSSHLLPCLDRSTYTYTTIIITKYYSVRMSKRTHGQVLRQKEKRNFFYESHVVITLAVLINLSNLFQKKKGQVNVMQYIILMSLFLSLFY